MIPVHRIEDLQTSVFTLQQRPEFEGRGMRMGKPSCTLTHQKNLERYAIKRTGTNFVAHNPKFSSGLSLYHRSSIRRSRRLTRLAGRFR